MTNEWVIRRPDDWHVHLRQSPDLAGYSRDLAAGGFVRALVMPNTIPPLRTPEGLRDYAAQIRRASPGLTPLLTFKVFPDLSDRDVASLKEAGALAGKLYPAGVTTNSEDGITDVRALDPVFAAMADEGLVLCIHGEDPDAPPIRREASFLPELSGIVDRHPTLRIVLEHVSTAAAVRLLADLPDRVAATVTVQHLLLCRDDLLGGALKPHLFCKPLLGSRDDREALREVVLSGSERYFFGSDSAPHPVSRKESAAAPAGVYSAPVALAALAAFFEKEGRPELLEPYVSETGAAFYGQPLNDGTLTLVREPWTVPERYGDVVPLYAGETLSWRPLAAPAT